MKPLPPSWFAGDAVDLAPKLLGKIVRHGSCAGIIVETEAYTIDPASHGYRITPKSRAMRDTYGHWYVYFTYGMHWCSNITTNRDGIGAILIRAVEPIEGIAVMKRRRGTDVIRALCSGPAKFCQAFGIGAVQNGLPVGGAIAIYDAPTVDPANIGTSGRIGVSKGQELPWRFYIRNNPFASRPEPKHRT